MGDLRRGGDADLDDRVGRPPDRQLVDDLQHVAGGLASASRRPQHPELPLPVTEMTGLSSRGVLTSSTTLAVSAGRVTLFRVASRSDSCLFLQFRAGFCQDRSSGSSPLSSTEKTRGHRPRVFAGRVQLVAGCPNFVLSGREPHHGVDPTMVRVRPRTGRMVDSKRGRRHSTTVAKRAQSVNSQSHLRQTRSLDNASLLGSSSRSLT